MGNSSPFPGFILTELQFGKMGFTELNIFPELQFDFPELQFDFTDLQLLGLVKSV